MRYWLIIFVFFLSEVSAQVNCLTITTSDQFFSATGQGQTEEEARTSATSSLISQISSYVTTRTDLTTSIENQVAQQTLVNLSSTRSQLRLDGLKFDVCDSGKKGDKSITVIAYIKKEDLEKSAEFVKSEVESYMSLISTKKALEIDYMADSYLAFLTTFYTPYPVPYQVGTEKIENLKPYLERQIRDYLNKVELTCSGVEIDPLYPQDHFILNLKLKNSNDLNLNYNLEIASLNAKSQIDYNGGKVPVIFQPLAATEVFKGKLNLKTTQIPANLEDLSRQIIISREFEFIVDFSKIIQIDFSISEEGDFFKLIPNLKNISVKNLEWISNGRLLSSEQSPKILKSELGSQILLKINKQENLSVSKAIKGGSKENSKTSEKVIAKISESENPSQETPLANATDSSSPTISKDGLIEILDFKALQSYLEKLKSSGKAVYGKKSDFVYPEKCWVVLINPESRNVEYILEPLNKGKKDIKKGTIYQDFESQLKGMVAIWVEFY